MEDRHLIDLIKRGAAAWEGPSPRAASARYARQRHWTRWRYVATLSAAAAGLLLIAGTVAGGPGPALHHLGISTIGSIEPPPAPSPVATPHVDQPPARQAPAAPPAKSQPTAPKTEPTAAPTAASTTGGHEPGASPTPSPTPTTRK